MNNYLVIGYGGAGKRAFRVLCELLPNATIYIWNTSRQATNPKDSFFVDSFEKAINLNPKGVFVATPTSTHIFYAERFLNVADWIVIDKPLDSSLNKCEVFERNAKFSRTKVYINFQRRYLACWKILKETVKNKPDELLYGNVRIASFYPSWRPNKLSEELYAAREDLGGGVLLTECHEIDLIGWIFGPIINVTSRTCTWGSNDKNVENQANLLLDVCMPYGNRSISLVLDDYIECTERFAEFVFVKNIYRIYEDENLIEIIDRNSGKHEKKILDVYDPYKELLFAVLNNSEDIPTVRDGLVANGIIDAAKKSSLLSNSVVVSLSVTPREGYPYLEAAVEELISIFGENVVSIYGLGSLGYGGFVEGWSDFDIDVIVKKDDRDPKVKYELGKQVESKIKNMGFERIDIRVYDYESLNARNTILEYGQCSRATMLCDSAVLLMGVDIRNRIIRPSINEQNHEACMLLKKMLGNSKEWWSSLPWDDIAAHYALAARLLYTMNTGKVVGKETAISFLLDNYSTSFSPNQIQWFIWALAVRKNYDKHFFDNNIKSYAIHSLIEALNIVKDIILEGKND